MPDLIHWTEIVGLADSPFAKAQADLLIYGAPDGSGVPVEVRRKDIAAQHEVVDFRLVPAGTLRNVVHTMRAAAEEHRALLARLAEMTARCPRELWPDDMRRAADMLDQTMGGTDERR